VASQQVLPRRLSGTGQTETIKNSRSSSQDSNMQVSYKDPQPEDLGNYWNRMVPSYSG
jgi:hypothetical protein